MVIFLVIILLTDVKNKKYNTGRIQFYIAKVRYNRKAKLIKRDRRNCPLKLQQPTLQHGVKSNKSELEKQYEHSSERFLITK